MSNSVRWPTRSNQPSMPGPSRVIRPATEDQVVGGAASTASAGLIFLWQPTGGAPGPSEFYDPFGATGFFGA